MATNGQARDLFGLEELRRERDWTYLELTESIVKVTGKRRDEDCWRRICQGLTTEPQGRTLDILDCYFAVMRPKRRVRRAS